MILALGSGSVSLMPSAWSNMPSGQMEGQEKNDTLW